MAVYRVPPVGSNCGPRFSVLRLRAMFCPVVSLFAWDDNCTCRSLQEGQKYLILLRVHTLCSRPSHHGPSLVHLRANERRQLLTGPLWTPPRSKRTLVSLREHQQRDQCKVFRARFNEHKHTFLTNIQQLHLRRKRQCKIYYCYHYMYILCRP